LDVKYSYALHIGTLYSKDACGDYIHRYN